MTPKTNGFYGELKGIKEDYPDATFWFLEREEIPVSDDKRPVNLYDCLHGFCVEFAKVLQEVFGYPIFELRNEEEGFIHAFCIKEDFGKRFYIDARGITDDFEAFSDEYADWLIDPRDPLSEVRPFSSECLPPDENVCRGIHEYITRDYPDYYAFSV